MKNPFEYDIDISPVDDTGDVWTLTGPQELVLPPITRDQAKYAAHAINQHDKLVSGIQEAVNTMMQPAVQAEGDWQQGMFCGLEDRGIVDRYEACMYGYEMALEKVQEWIIDGLAALLAEEGHE